MAYIVRADIEALFGVTNIDKWADLNNNSNASEITARITTGIAFSEAYFEGRMRGTRYKVPLTISSGSGLTDMIMATYAGEWLYRSRVHADDIETGVTSWITRLVRRADDLTSMIAAGTIRLDATLSHKSGTVPQVVK